MPRSCYICGAPKPNPQFKFPKDDRLQEWCSILQIDLLPQDKVGKSGPILCSNHFQAIASQIPPNDGFFLNTSLDDLSNLNSYWLEALFTDDNSLNPSKSID